MQVYKDNIHRGRTVKCHLCGQTHIKNGDKCIFSWTGGWGYHRFAYSCLKRLVNNAPDPTLSFGIEPVR